MQTLLKKDQRASAARWASMGALVCLLLIYVTSIWWGAIWTRANGWGVTVIRGGLSFGHGPAGYPEATIECGIVLPFQWWWYRHSSPFGWYIVVPLWMPSLLLGLLAAWLWCKRKSAGPNQCESCGYDLTGVPSPVCPECGTPRRDEAKA